MELAEPGYAAYIDEVEVGRRVGGHIRVAFAVGDAERARRARPRLREPRSSPSPRGRRGTR
jgi:hypothetical protein